MLHLTPDDIKAFVTRREKVLDILKKGEHLEQIKRIAILSKPPKISDSENQADEEEDYAELDALF